MSSHVLSAVSPCSLAFIKHLVKRQITALDIGVPVSFYLSTGLRGTLPVFHRAGCDTGVVTDGAPEALTAVQNRVAFCF